MNKKLLIGAALAISLGSAQATTWVANYTDQPFLITLKTTVNPAQLVIGGAALAVAEQIATKVAQWIIEQKMKHPVDAELFEKAVFEYQKTISGMLNFSETQPVLPNMREMASFSKFDLLGVSMRTELQVARPDGTLLFKRYWSPSINNKTRGGNFTLKILPDGANGYKLLMQCNSFCVLGMLPGADYPVNAKQISETIKL